MESNFYYALGHDLRRRMIKMLGDNEFSSFTTLKKELKVSTGTIYHHLDALSQLIEQGKDKKYYLTELGKHAYDSLQDNIESIISPDFSKKEFNSPILKSLMFLTPKKIINYEEGYKIYLVIVSIGLLILGLILCNLNNLFPILLFFTNIFQSFQNTNVSLQIFFNVFFL